MKHILFTLKGCPYEVLDDELLIRDVLVDAARLAKSRVLAVSSHKFDPHGVTAVVLLAESHISIHTWPEYGTAVCDVFTCGDQTHPRAAAIYMADAMGSIDCQSETIIRS